MQLCDDGQVSSDRGTRFHFARPSTTQTGRWAELLCVVTAADDVDQVAVASLGLGGNSWQARVWYRYWTLSEAGAGEFLLGVGL